MMSRIEQLVYPFVTFDNKNVHELTHFTLSLTTPKIFIFLGETNSTIAVSLNEKYDI